MSIALFDGDQISHDSYLIPHGRNSPIVKSFPRIIGGILQESGVVEKTLTLKSYLIPPASASRKDVEDFFHDLNEKIGSKEATLEVNGNTYPFANVRNINYDPFITNKFTKFEIDFELNNQNTDLDIRQLSVPGLQNFTRGRKMVFESEMDDGSIKTFYFWHNFDVIKNFETEITIKHSDIYGGTGGVIRVGGFEKIICKGWIIGPDAIGNRRNLEAYFYNCINGPLGRLGTLTIGNDQVIEKCILTDITVEDSTKIAVRYELTFIASLQC